MANHREIIYFLAIFALFGNLSISYAAQDAEQPAQCGETHPTGVQKRVVSGTTALPGAWPWQALLLYSYRKTFICSGALIHPSWILTAAHCVSRSGTFYVRLGEFDRGRYEGHEQTIKVVKIVVHPRHDYPTRRNNDLAMIKLERPAVLSKWVGTVCLPTAEDFLHGKLVCYATGWGLTRKSYTYSRKLQQAHVPLVTKSKCRRRHRPWGGTYWSRYQTQVTNEMLCGGDDTTGASTCLGDSGGPYVCRNPTGYWVLQGITSWGSKKCRLSESYSVFSKVQVFTSWIDKVMNGTNDSERPSEITRRDRLDYTTWSKIVRRWLARMLGG